jgi:hypothetical protein
MSRGRQVVVSDFRRAANLWRSRFTSTRTKTRVYGINSAWTRLHGGLGLIRCFKVFRSLRVLEIYWSGSQGPPCGRNTDSHAHANQLYAPLSGSDCLKAF